MAKKNSHKPTTLEDLADMINGGFSNMQQQLYDVQGRLGNVEGTLHDVVEELNATHEDVRYIRTTVNMLVRNDAAQDAAIKTLSTRVARLEKKVGLAN
jgi:chaperonin cofactor prefoldin